jgi:hypothetical protein
LLRREEVIVFLLLFCTAAQRELELPALLQVLRHVEGAPPSVVRDRACVYNSDGTARVMVAPGGVAATAIAAAAGRALGELGPLLSPTCRSDSIIGLLGIVLGDRGQPEMLVLELAQVRGRRVVVVASLPASSAIVSGRACR